MSSICDMEPESIRSQDLLPLVFSPIYSTVSNPGCRFGTIEAPTVPEVHDCEWMKALALVESVSLHRAFRCHFQGQRS